MNPQPCPDEMALWPAVVDEPPRPDMARHLARCPSCRARVDEDRRRLQMFRQARNHSQPQAEPCSANSRASFVPEIPFSIGEYAILGVLGQGGQAVVYRGWHPRLNAEIAIKRLLQSSNLRDSALVREALLLASVRHWALPQPLDLEEIGGEQFLLMELIHGEPLADCRARLSSADILRVARELAAAIADLHGAGLLHLDLSPNNVLIDEQGRCRLIDFGLARTATFSAGNSEDVLTGGTPGFIAPEAFRFPQQLDRRTDVYAIGALLHYMISGQPPAMLDLGETLSIGSCVDRISGQLCAVCLRAIASDPDARLQTADELLAALEVIREGRSPSRRWLAAAALAASLLIGSNPELTEVALAEVFVHREAHVRRLVHAPDVRRGDEIAFVFDWAGLSAGLAIRTPAGRVVPLKPFERSEQGVFRYPPTGGAVLRQEAGTYVVYFAPLRESEAGGEAPLLHALDRLPPPPSLSSGKKLFLIAGTILGDDGSGDDAAPNDWTAWKRSIAQCRLAFPGFSAIAFRVD